MKRLYTLLSAIAAVLVATSCASQYDMKGTSNVSTLDGRMLYLKVLNGEEMKSIDSCDVVHGEFHFSGSVDSVKLGSVYMGDDGVIPVIIEAGDISIKLDDTELEVSGTEYNDSLFAFLKKYNKVKGDISDLQHQYDQALLDGDDMDAVEKTLVDEQVRLFGVADSIVTDFVTRNFDNILGPSAFLLVTSSYEYPELTPWVMDIMGKATDNFKNDPYVKSWYEKAKENEEIVNGMRQAPVEATPQVAAGAQTTPATPAPTPNELAKPAPQSNLLDKPVATQNDVAQPAK